ncbi:hypothetical protein OPT61_g4534 [Boeremia exigua]|uniref:Uncharacterized protein n=1 Tax=Boeremia exigua TaxID=749465 RepID=A0ACC2IDS4_9PLEO|nr:hypothetical protein OPT61_g4534 [Boeremia exigua]
MDSNRHHADSESKYIVYFDVLHSKIIQYSIEARDTYNMDEKGFAIGVVGRSTRIFSRRAWEKGEVRQSNQDGNRDTQTLQPLDVVCFKPLSSNYSKELSNYLQASQGLSPIGKPEFMHLFWPAWTNTFTKTLVLSAFRVTGISPPNADVVLDRFRHTSQSRSPSISSGISAYSGDDWLKACSLLRAEVKDPRSRAGLRATLHLQKKKKQQPNKQLQLPPNEEYAGEMKELRAANKRYNDMIAEEKRVRRVREKEDRAKLQAVKAAEVAKRKAKKEHQKQAQDAEKSIQLPKTVKRKLLQPAAPRKKQNRGGVGGGSQPVAHERSPSPPTRTSTHGRKLKVPKRFRHDRSYEYYAFASLATAVLRQQVIHTAAALGHVQPVFCWTLTAETKKHADSAAERWPASRKSSEILVTKTTWLFTSSCGREGPGGSACLCEKSGIGDGAAASCGAARVGVGTAAGSSMTRNVVHPWGLASSDTWAAAASRTGQDDAAPTCTFKGRLVVGAVVVTSSASWGDQRTATTSDERLGDFKGF